jgi:tRNA uridine 5-carboxymethylaminomethyl modification enzyme
LEPEGHDTAELYVNGLSTSLPAGVQTEILRTVPGLESVRMTRAGYAIEYDFYPPTQLDPTLQVKAVPGLFFAGQINGTTGYEEAAGQGTVAGLNAALTATDRPGLLLGRENSYIGVLVDDLVTKGVDEPYRLFTSRSEFRLTVRQDNALRRLAPVLLPMEAYTPAERARIESRLIAEERALSVAEETSVTPETVGALLLRSGSPPPAHAVRIGELAKRPGVSLRELFKVAGVLADAERDAITSAELELKYQGYFAREREHADRLRRLGSVALGPGIPYSEMRSLSFEARQKLERLQPANLSQAGRVPGVSPADLQNLLIELEKRRRGHPLDATGSSD